jgi:hypothetical protein
MTTHSITAPTPQIWRVPLWAWAPIALAVSAEACINALRAYGLGQQLEHFTVNVSVYGWPATVSIAGSILVLAAVAISLAQARAGWVAFQPGAMARQRLVAVPVAALLLSVSVAALSLTLLEAQRVKSGGEGGQRTAFDNAKDAVTDAEAEYARLNPPAEAIQRAEQSGLKPGDAGYPLITRTMGEVKSAMDAAKVPRAVFRRTAECTDVTKDESFDACKPILDLRQEMARAIRKQELEAALPVLKAKLEGMPRPAEPTWFEETASSWWGWLVGSAVVGLATFGSVIFAKPIILEGAKAKSDGPRWDVDGQSDYPALKDHPAQLANNLQMVKLATARFTIPRRPEGPAGGLSVVPKKPEGPTPSAPEVPADRPAGKNDRRQADVLAFIRTEAKVSGPIESQAYLADATGTSDATLSDWLAEWEKAGLIVRRQDGRRKVIALPEGEMAIA